MGGHAVYRRTTHFVDAWDDPTTGPHALAARCHLDYVLRHERFRPFAGGCVYGQRTP
jgi:hypothetical protein